MALKMKNMNYFTRGHATKAPRAVWGQYAECVVHI